MNWKSRWHSRHRWNLDRWDSISVLWLLLAAIAAVFVFDDFGETFDEDKHVIYGDMILAWFTSFFADDRALSYSRDYLYGGAFDLAGAIVRALLPLGTNDAQHLLGAIVGWLGLLGTWRLGRRLGGPATGCVALLLISVTPTFVGHAFNNPKDAPFAVGYVWALYGIVGLVKAAPNVTRRRWIAAGLFVGLSASVRVAGLLSFCYLGLAVAFVFHYGHRVRRFADPRSLLQLAGRAIGAFGLGWTAMIAAWPWAQLQPLRRPVFALSYMSKFALAPRKFPFNGEEMYGFEIPWDYIPRMLAFKLPELILVGLALSLLVAPLLLLRERDLRRTASWALLLLAVVIPPAYAILKGSTLYGGIRHFMFLMPPLAVLAAGGLVTASRLVFARSRGAGIGLCSALSIAWSFSLATVVQLHPLQYVYYNQLAGGLQGAEGNFELDYYGGGYRPAVRQFLTELWEREPETYLSKKVRYSGCGGGGELPAHFVKDKEKPDFHIGSTRGDCRDKYPTRPIFTELVRDGVSIVIVRDLRKKPKKAKR
ncbi:MAG: glycosyltransferase family 39 protein [Nannocystaceae bacterium]|nr:glycosyltransferase family 39 protein [Nannocystaceae bacterium]